jgi:glucoamylase
VAAECADREGETEVAAYLRETADTWNASLEDWLYVNATDLAHQIGVEGYYVRLAPLDENGLPALDHQIRIANRPSNDSIELAAEHISVDALALVRFGLRAASDPRIVNTVRVVDALLKTETPNGPAWRRYNGDGYGEHDDGSPYDGTGVGRAWPVLTGERGHYELAAGNRTMAEQLLSTMARFAGNGGLIPEQVWDSTDIPECGLYCGRPSGSAMPLVWAHAEYVKLHRSLREGRIFDLPPQTVARYRSGRIDPPYAIWRFNYRIPTLPAGKTLRIETLIPAVVHWSSDDWNTVQDSPTNPTGLELHLLDLPTRTLPPGGQIVFTFYWPAAERWEGQDFSVIVIAES